MEDFHLYHEKHFGNAKRLTKLDGLIARRAVLWGLMARLLQEVCYFPSSASGS